MSVLTRPPVNPFEPPPGPVWRFSVDDYHRLIAGGVLGEEDRVELLEGWIVPKMTHNPPHDGTIQIVSKRIGRRLPPNWEIRVRSAVTLDDSEPEPDLAIVRGDETTYLRRQPAANDIGMLVEVAESTLEQDQRQKMRIYARALIPAYWIINLIHNQVEVFSNPGGSAEAPAYADRGVCRADDLIPLILDGRIVAQVRAGDLLP